MIESSVGDSNGLGCGINGLADVLKVAVLAE